jgi:1A family penicillin-binding protein
MPLPFLKKKSEFTRSRFEQKRRVKAKRKKIFVFLLKLGLVLFIIGALVLSIAFAWYSRGLPNPNKIMERSVAQSTKIYDAKGETILYEIHGEEKRTLVKLEDIPDYVQWATISAEDENFYQHKGFDLKAIFRTIVTNVLRGEKAGGSTITQQFVKNAILTSEKRYSRKIKEVILSYRMERKFTKDEILQLYLNEIPYGSTSYGIQSAAQTFLGKNVQDLTLGEAALLAGLPKAPTYYSPYGSNVDQLFARKDYILDLMAENGYISQEQADQAKAEKVEFSLKRESIRAPHFTLYVREQLAEMFGEKFVEQGGLKVITTLDLEKQEIAEEAVANGVEARGAQHGFSNAALVALEPGTGKILAMVGSKDDFETEIDGNVNVVTRLRQPGSSIKPLVYAAAFDKGYTPDTILFDVNTSFKTETVNYEPKNYDLGQRGPVSMRKALQGSLNIPAVKTLYLVGLDNMLNFFELMGYTSFDDRSRFGLALVLGGGEVQLLEHAAAFAIFPNQGIYHEPASILRVEDSEGEVLFEFEEKDRKVLDENIARVMNNVLSDNNARAYVFGSSNDLTIPGRHVAAKTGTTNDYRDAWTMGYTPSLVAGVWAGNNDNSEMARGAGGSMVAAPIWNEFMRRALEGTEVEEFVAYEPLKANKGILSGNFSIEKTVKVDTYSGKLATEHTPESATEERTYKEIHTILHYVNKDDPLGAAPSNPAADPQYNSWEASVQAWVQAKKDSEDPAEAEEYGFINETVPTEFDDVHTQENKPTLFFTSPQSGETISSQVLSASVKASAPRGITKVEYYLDDQLIHSTSIYPYNLNYTISSLFVNGYHTLKVVAYDDVDNSNQVSIDVNILADREPPGASWLFPGEGTIYTTSQFPVYTAVKISDLMVVKKVNFYYRQAGSGSFNLYASEVAPSSETVSVNWTGVDEPGDYELKSQVELTDGEWVDSEVITVTVN